MFWEGEQVSPGSETSCTSKGGKVHPLSKGQEEISLSPSSSAMPRLSWTDWSGTSLTSPFLLWSRKHP